MQTALYLFPHIFICVLKEGSDIAIEEVLCKFSVVHNHLACETVFLHGLCDLVYDKHDALERNPLSKSTRLILQYY